MYMQDIWRTFEEPGERVPIPQQRRASAFVYRQTVSFTLVWCRCIPIKWDKGAGGEHVVQVCMITTGGKGLVFPKVGMRELVP